MQGHLSAFSEVPAEDEFKRTLERQLRVTAGRISENFSDYFDNIARETVVSGLGLATADEGTIWLVDVRREILLPVFNSGPNAAKFVGNFQQSLRSGMISMVVATEQPIYENDVHWNRQQDRTLDSRLGVHTTAMIACPFYFAGELRGVLSGVQLRSADTDFREGDGFTWDNLQVLQQTATLVGRLLEHRLLLRILGTEGEV